MRVLILGSLVEQGSLHGLIDVLGAVCACLGVFGISVF